MPGLPLAGTLLDDPALIGAAPTPNALADGAATREIAVITTAATDTARMPKPARKRSNIPLNPPLGNEQNTYEQELPYAIRDVLLYPYFPAGRMYYDSAR